MPHEHLSNRAKNEPPIQLLTNGVFNRLNDTYVINYKLSPYTVSVRIIYLCNHTFLKGNLSEEEIDAQSTIL